MTNDQDIKLKGNIPPIEGHFHLTFSMFSKNQNPENTIKISIYSGEKQKMTYSADREWLTSSLLSFVILKDMTLYPGDHLRIHYDGNDSFFISDFPESYMILDERDYPINSSLNEANKTKKKTPHESANKQGKLTAFHFALIVTLLVKLIVGNVL